MFASKSMLSFGLGLTALTASLAAAPDARACGGCFGPPGPPTQVTAHRMAFAVSTHRTILWDQIEYAGAPSSFGWVLPIRSAVDVGVSTDALFQRLDSFTQPRISPPPPPTCPPPEKKCRTTCPHAYPSADAGLASDTKAADTASAPVDVWSHEVVGPYEATQLSSTDSTALRTWLTDHGYVLPSAIAPVIDAYVAEGFGFLAVKLVPGAGVDRMVPIRIAFDGASPTLPLRMVAAGTGENVGIKLFVLGEGRWEAQNFDNAEIATSDLIWDWRAMGSNFGTLENAAISTHSGKVWIAESSDDASIDSYFGSLPPPPPDDAGDASVFKSATDLDEMHGAFPTRTSVRVTRLFAQLPSSALATDLQLQASTGGVIPVARTAPVGINYVCPSYTYEVDCPGISPVCDGDAGANDAGFPIFPFFGDGSSSDGGGSSGCSVSDVEGSPLPFVGGAAAVMIGLSALRRRRRK